MRLRLAGLTAEDTARRYSRIGGYEPTMSRKPDQAAVLPLLARFMRGRMCWLGVHARTHERA